MSGFHDGFPIVYARDVGRSLAFYRDLLGFEEGGNPVAIGFRE